MGIIFFKDKLGVNSNVTFAVYEINDVAYEAYRTELDLFDNTWLSNLTDSNLKAAFQSKSQKTANRIKKDIGNKTSSLVKNAGEHIVVYLSRNVISSTLHYRGIPIAELYKDKVIGNPGFDFFNENDIIGRVIFGEGKFRSSSLINKNSYKTAYKEALSQVVKFIREKKDTEEYTSLQYFLSELSKNNFSTERGYSIGFSLERKDINPPMNINNIFVEISSNADYLKLEKEKELLIIGIVF